MTQEARLRVLSFTTLFPNPLQPLHGLFIKNRLERMADYCDMTVVAPVNVVRHPRAIRHVPRAEMMDGFRVYRPYFGVIPGICKHWDGGLLFRQTVGQLRRGLRAEDYDIVDAHYAYPDGVAGQRLATQMGKPFVISLRGSDIYTLAAFPRRRRLIQQVLERASGVIAVSRALKRQAEALGANEGRVYVIPNGVDTATFQPIDRYEARRRLGWAFDHRVVLSVGRLAPVKGLSLLLNAVKMVGDRLGSMLRCYLVGDGELRASLQKEIQDLRLQETVVLAGSIPPDQLPVWYSAADVCCLLSVSEGCPNVVLEALACGTPIVATAVGGIPDMIQEGVNGLLVHSRGVEDVASRIERALITTWVRQTIASSPEMRDWSEVAREQVQLLHEIAARS